MSLFSPAVALDIEALRAIPGLRAVENGTADAGKPRSISVWLTGSLRQDASEQALKLTE